MWLEQSPMPSSSLPSLPCWPIRLLARAGMADNDASPPRTVSFQTLPYRPREILILAFNRKAALEIRRRLLGLIEDGADAAINADINRRIRDAGKNKRADRDEIEASAVDAIAIRLNITLPHVMTFHALAYAIVHPGESILYNGAEGESQGLNRAFQQVIDDHLQSPAFREKIRELMLAHFSERIGIASLRGDTIKARRNFFVFVGHCREKVLVVST